MIGVILLVAVFVVFVMMIKKIRSKKSGNTLSKNRFCHKCGNEIPGDAKFCPKCGTAIVQSETLKQRKVSKQHNVSKQTKTPNLRNIQIKEKLKRIFDMRDRKKRIIAIICLIIGVIVFVSNLNGVRSSYSRRDYDYNYNYSYDDDGIYAVDDDHVLIDLSHFNDDSDYDDDDDYDYNYGSLNNKAEIHCSSCGGSGRCRSCSGSGKDTVYVAGGTTTTNSCNYCYGSGRCRSCGGDGKQ